MSIGQVTYPFSFDDLLNLKMNFNPLICDIDTENEYLVFLHPNSSAMNYMHTYANALRSKQKICSTFINGDRGHPG